MIVAAAMVGLRSLGLMPACAKHLPPPRRSRNAARLLEIKLLADWTFVQENTTQAVAFAQVQALGEREFVLERISRSQRAVLDGRGELLRELVIQRHGTSAINEHWDLSHRMSLCEDGEKVTESKCPNKS